MRSPKDTESQLMVELRALERLALEQLIAVALSRGPAGRKVLAETLRRLNTPRVHNEYTGPEISE